MRERPHEAAAGDFIGMSRIVRVVRERAKEKPWSVRFWHTMAEGPRDGMSHDNGVTPSQ